jgi:hypothetical protein
MAAAAAAQNIVVVGTHLYFRFGERVAAAMSALLLLMALMPVRPELMAVNRYQIHICSSSSSSGSGSGTKH